jgi:hypothetical protein
LAVSCGGIRGEYIISEKKVLFGGERLPPAKFEEKSGVKSRRWKRSIKVESGNGGAKPVSIGEVLDKMGVGTSLRRSGGHAVRQLVVEKLFFFFYEREKL